jgi:hypothetical protein
MLLNFARAARLLTVFCVMGLLSGFSLAQATDPIVGTWNITVTVTAGCLTECRYIGMAIFDQGGTLIEQRGTAVEYYRLGNVDRTALGRWWRLSTGTYPHEIKAKNFVFNPTTGELSATIIGTSSVTLSSNLQSFSGSGTAKIFNLSGTLIETETFTITGTRF